MIYYTETGLETDTPVVFLHAGSYSGTMWADITTRLGGLHCIVPDLPGHGYSRPIELRSLEQAADEVATLIIHKFGERAVNVVGISFGGYVGLMLMARHPRMVQRAMLSGIHLDSVPNPWVMNLFAGLMSPLMRFRGCRRKMAAGLGVSDPHIYDRTDDAANHARRAASCVCL